MNRTTASLVAFAACAVCSTAYGLYTVADTGQWPKTWPADLAPLRKQSRTLVGPEVESGGVGADGVASRQLSEP